MRYHSTGDFLHINNKNVINNHARRYSFLLRMQTGIVISGEF